MSVLKNKRSVSSLEFYHNAIMLRREITMLLLRDFGIKDKVRSVKSLYGVPGMEPEDEQKFREIVEKYEMKATIIEEYPAWLIDTFRVDVSYMTDEEYANCMKTLYNALEHAQIDKAKLTGEKYMRKSVGIGSQISQISGVYYPTRIDNYCKIVKGMKYYGRYMDDIYIIHEDKEYLKGLLNDIQGICDELGLFINPKKTQIVKLSHGFTFLKIKYNLTETGKVQERISKDSVTRMRRKLKKFRKLMDAGEMSFDDVRCAYASWKGGVSHYDSYNVVKSMDKLFDELFIHPFIEGGHRDEQNKNEQK